VAVYDRWHKDETPGARACKCGTAKHPLYPSAAHKKGLRWQVRWRTPDGKQEKRNFALKVGENAELHADAYDAQVQREIDTDDYTGRDAAKITFQEFAEQVRKSRTHDDVSAESLERHLRLHAYPYFGPSSLRLMSKRPSLTQAWLKGLQERVGPTTARSITGDVSGIYEAAIGDGIISVNPLRSSTVTRPDPPPRKARAWPADRVRAMAGTLSARYAVIPYLGAGTGMRQGEVFGLAVEDITFLGKNPVIRVQRQVKIVNGRLCFALPKRRKTREIPLSPQVRDKLARHFAKFPSHAVTLPWHDPRDKKLHGKEITVNLAFTNKLGRAIRRPTFDDMIWNPARERAAIPPGRDDGMHALRHTYVSVQLGAGRGVTEVAAWIGDTAAIVLGTYAHFIPGGEDDSRQAVDAFLAPCAPDVPSDAPATGKAQGQGG
jgi:integrase